MIKVCAAAHMTHWDDIRALARRQRACVLSLGAAPDEPSSAERLLQAADRCTGFERVPVPPGDNLLYGGQAMLDLDWEIIRFDAGVANAEKIAGQAHENAVGHCLGRFDHQFLEGLSLSIVGPLVHAQERANS